MPQKTKIDSFLRSVLISEELPKGEIFLSEKATQYLGDMIDQILNARLARRIKMYLGFAPYKTPMDFVSIAKEETVTSSAVRETILRSFRKLRYKQLSEYLLHLIKAKEAELVSWDDFSASETEVIGHADCDLLVFHWSKELPTRLYNSLRRGGFDTLGSLLAVEDPTEFLKIRGLGEGGYQILLDFLARHGYPFAG